MSTEIHGDCKISVVVEEEPTLQAVAHAITTLRNRTVPDHARLELRIFNDRFTLVSRWDPTKEGK